MYRHRLACNTPPGSLVVDRNPSDSHLELTPEPNQKMLTGLIIVIVLVALFVVLYNRLVSLRVRAQNAWSDIDVQLKRRSDLVPNLVETVKGYAAHERGTLDAVTQARTRAVAAQSAGPPCARRPRGELTDRTARTYCGGGSVSAASGLGAGSAISRDSSLL